jgi:TRAP-type C4-dicarboxylate transport system substrate-binding protein
MKRYLVFLLFLTICTVTLVSCGGSKKGEASGGDGAKAAESNKVINWKFSLEVSENNFQAVAWKAWAEKITKESNGRLTFTLYYDETLLDYNSAFDQLKAGIADVADIHRFASSGFHISENWKAITSGVPVGHEADVSYDLWNEFPELRDEFKDVYVPAQSFNGGTIYQILSVKKPIRTVADMKGLQIWCEADYNEFVTQCGATPINAPFPEVYTSLQKNMFDGLMIPKETLISCNFAEVCKYITLVDIAYATGPGHLINLDSWKALPEDIKDIINANASFVENANHQGFLDIESIALDKAVKDYGVTAIELTPEAKKGFHDTLYKANLNVAKKLDAQGLPGTRFVEKVAEFSRAYE